MSKFIETIRNLAIYVSRHVYNSAIDNAAQQLKDFLADYPKLALQDIGAINNLEELEQIKFILDSLKGNLHFDVADSIYTAIDQRKQAIEIIRKLGRNFQELFNTERELSKRAGGVADLLTKYQIPLTAIAKNANFIPKAVEAYRTIQETDNEFSCLAPIDLTSLDGIRDFAHALRFNIGQSESFGRRVAAILDITLSYSKIDYLINTLLQDQTLLALMLQNECKQLETWPVAPMQRLPRLTLFPKEINPLLKELSENPTVISQQVTDIMEMINYFFKEKISKHTTRLNQAKKAMDFKLQLEQENSNYYLNSLSKLFFNTVIQWETEQTPELKPVVDSVKQSMTGSLTLGNAANRPISRMLAMSSKPSSRMGESSIPIFDNYPERLDRIGEPLLAIRQPSFTSPRRQLTTTLQGEELVHFKTMLSAIQKRQSILAGVSHSVTPSTLATNKTPKRKAAAGQDAGNDQEKASLPSNPSSQQAGANTTIAIKDIAAAIQLLDNYRANLKKAYPTIDNPLPNDTSVPQLKFNQYLKANDMIAPLNDLLDTQADKDHPELSIAIYDLIHFITDGKDDAVTQDMMLNEIARFEETFCRLSFEEKVLAALKTFLVAAVGFVLGAIIASAAIIIAAAATGVAPPLSIAGITTCLTTGWSIYAAMGGAVLGTIVGTTAGIKRFFFSDNPRQYLVNTANTFVNSSYPKSPTITH